VCREESSGYGKRKTMAKVQMLVLCSRETWLENLLHSSMGGENYPRKGKRGGMGVGEPPRGVRRIQSIKQLTLPRLRGGMMIEEKGEKSS